MLARESIRGLDQDKDPLFTVNFMAELRDGVPLDIDMHLVWTTLICLLPLQPITG